MSSLNVRVFTISSLLLYLWFLTADLLYISCLSAGQHFPVGCKLLAHCSTPTKQRLGMDGCPRLIVEWTKLWVLLYWKNGSGGNNVIDQRLLSAIEDDARLLRQQYTRCTGRTWSAAAPATDEDSGEVGRCAWSALLRKRVNWSCCWVTLFQEVCYLWWESIASYHHEATTTSHIILGVLNLSRSVSPAPDLQHPISPRRMWPKTVLCSRLQNSFFWFSFGQSILQHRCENPYLFTQWRLQTCICLLQTLMWSHGAH